MFWDGVLVVDSRCCFVVDTGLFTFCLVLIDLFYLWVVWLFTEVWLSFCIWFFVFYLVFGLIGFLLCCVFVCWLWFVFKFD